MKRQSSLASSKLSAALRTSAVMVPAVQEIEASLPPIRLGNLRKLRGITQVELARRIGIHQNNISRLENGSDMQLSTLRNYLFNMGAQLELRARINGEVIVLDLPEVSVLSHVPQCAIEA